MNKGELIAKKGEYIIITDFGSAIPAGCYNLNIPYELTKDLYYNIDSNIFKGNTPN